MNSPREAADQFDLKGGITELKPYGSGNINHTFLATTDADETILLQKLNSKVFPTPRHIMENLSVIIRHMDAEMHRLNLDSTLWQLPRIVPCRNGQEFYISPEGSCWRAVWYIKGTVSYEVVESPQQAEKAGIALGRFHRLTDSLDAGRLHDTLPGFHKTTAYLERYHRIWQQGGDRTRDDSATAAMCRDLIESHRRSISILDDAERDNQIQIRTTHGDPKISNILFCEQGNQPVSMIDLDTVKPGLIQTDIGDFFRSVCNPAGEETPNLNDISFDIHRFKSGLAGYAMEMRDLLTEADIEYIFDFIQLMTLELGIRFFTDYLEGDHYFKTLSKTHNLKRAAVQLTLVKSIKEQESNIREIIDRQFLS